MTRSIFRHNRPVTPITDTHPYSCDNVLRLGQPDVRPSLKTALEAAPKPFSAEFEELSPYSGIFCYKSFKPKDFAGFSP
jgi:hypothetical protein